MCKQRVVHTSFDSHLDDTNPVPYREHTLSIYAIYDSALTL